MTRSEKLDGIRQHVLSAQRTWRAQKQHEENRSSVNNLPFLTLTYAQSIDGSIAAKRGSPTLLSGPASMEMTHLLRSTHDAILVGVGTVAADNPSLNVRYVKGNNPQPIIIDSYLRCPLSIKLFTSPTCVKPILLCIDSLHDEDMKQRERSLKEAGAQIITCRFVEGEDGTRHVDLRDGFAKMKQRGIDSIMIEGGASIISSCLKESARMSPFINLVIVTIAPTFIGGLRIADQLANTVTAYPRIVDPQYHQLDSDLVIMGAL